MGWFIGILVISGLACFFLLGKKGPSQRQAATNQPAAALTRGEFHSISVSPGEAACDAVRELGKRRFLAREAPDLPLAACDASSCACHYIHHEDRRAGNDDRRAEHSLRTELYGSVENESERRVKGPDRRKS